MSVLLIDFLGRGGIAQCTEAWALELERHGADVRMATRPGRELASSPVESISLPERSSRGRAHLGLVRATAQEIRRTRPAHVVVQNYLIPPVEELIYRAARSAGSRVTIVLHNHRHHTRTSGLDAGLSRQVRRADAVLAHSAFVADRVAATTGRRPQVLPLPVQVGMVDRSGSVPGSLGGVSPLALHFGVLTRSDAKGTDLAVELARRGVPGWRFGFVGVGAPEVPGARRHAEYLESADLVAVVQHSAATILPYRQATQSGAVMLAQVLGSVVVASSVGGIPEQVEHERTGLLIPPGSPPEVWAEALVGLTTDVRSEMSAHARRTAWQRHEQFVEQILNQVGR